MPFREGIEVLLWALRHESGNPPEHVAQLAADLVVPALVKRLRLVEDRKRHPEIAAQQVKAPIVITGLPRTGSTHLQALLATRPGARSPLESGRCGCRPRRLRRRPPRPIRASPTSSGPSMAGQAPPSCGRSTPTAPGGPRRCPGLIDWGFVNQTYLAYQRIPAYYEWYLNADQRLVYEHHKRFLQHLQFRNPGDWVLKWPKHLFGLDALLEVYPDARIPWTHRNPGKVIPSCVSFVGTLRAMNSPLFEPKRFGAEWSSLEEMGLHRGLSVRARVGDDRFLDVHYNDLTADPVAAVTAHLRALRHPGRRRDGPPGYATTPDDNPQGKHGAHQYTPEQSGFDAGAHPPPLRGVTGGSGYRGKPRTNRGPKAKRRTSHHTSLHRHRPIPAVVA